MRVFHTEKHTQHDPRFFLVRGRASNAVEQPERA